MLELEENSNLCPFFVLEIPGCRQFISTLSEIQKEDTNGKILHGWNDYIEMQYMCSLTSKLHLLNMTMEIFSDLSKKRIQHTFLGDFDIDLFSLFVGPKSHKIELQHSDYKGSLYFECIAEQITKAVVVVDHLRFPSQTKFNCGIKGSSSVCLTVDKTARIELETLSYNRIADYPPLQITSQDNIIIEIPLLTIFNYNEQGSEYKTEIFIDGLSCPFSVNLKLENAPRYVQSATGIHYTNNFISKYNNLSHPDGVMTIEERPDLLFSECDLSCEPSYNPHRTIHPVELKIDCKL